MGAEPRGRAARAGPGTRAVPAWVLAASGALSVIALGVASYLTYTHYVDPTALACPDTGIVNCTLVTTSSWSRIGGIPVALLGLVWSVVMVALCSPWAWRRDDTRLDLARLVAAGLGAVMVLYLVYAELFGVGAICLWCTAMHVTTVSLFAVVLGARPALARTV